ncbi:hypothetical protein ABL78_6852 [Leptomonas seymouri]|uniref:Uncharacterized protein n=1 Tax=Leptomonas seymouri TaxID=5684 RepID=A0A0N0P3G6_LEPSE|nr:hypothetical protein ABL78_6852 [Leptomonas seymouri]|eukprot:KPI84096.1 hypothetical protein ABL78_6852 [Leptomonas seymouri]
MLKSSLKAPSSIDHDLFPLLTVRSCVSEADESKNGPRFCAEDKMTGAAYEIRSRKLELAREPADCDPTDQREDQRVSPPMSSSNLQKIRRQQARIDALLSAATLGIAPPSVALPIDIYIQEQPSTGDTYVASVDAFAGLSLGDIIRSGWGVMEEQVFLEILNAVESYGYASAKLPPHGNLSSDAIKQLLIVRDGASEARQPSRWVVSDWLLLSDDDGVRGNDGAADSMFDIESFIGDLEWMLHSSFAQLRISTSTDGAYFSAAQVEDVINETVERIRTFLMQLTAENAAAAAAAAAAEAANVGIASSGVHGPNALGGDAAHEGEMTDKAASVLAVGKISADEAKPDPSSAAPNGHAEASHSPPAMPSTKMPGHGGGARSGMRQSRNSPRQLCSSDYTNSAAAVKDSTRSMTLKDKMAYHQAALRNEQMLVNKQRRKNAPLPPRPTPVVKPTRKASAVHAVRLPADEEDVYYDAPSFGVTIKVKPSAYLTQGRQTSASGSSKSGRCNMRKLLSPHSARASISDCCTPRDGSRSTTTSKNLPQRASKQSQQQQVTTPHKQATTPRDLRERLLDDVVNMAVMNQRRRGQCLKLQQEADRKRREQRQDVLARSIPIRTAAPGDVQQRTMPAVLERPRVAITATSSSNGSNAPQATTYERQRGVMSRRSGTALTFDKGTCTVGGFVGVPPANFAAPSEPSGAFLFQMCEWPANVSESPEPTPPSPHARRVVHNYAAPPGAAAAQQHRTTLATPFPRAGAAAAATQAGQNRLHGRGRGAVEGRAMAITPVTRLLRPTIGQKPRKKVNVTATDGAREVPRGTQARTRGHPLRSARDAPATDAHLTAPRGMDRPGGVATGGHPLSARGKKQAVATPPAEAPVRDAPASSQLLQQQSAYSSKDKTAPYVKPLPLAALGLHSNLSSGTPHVPMAWGGTFTGNNNTSACHGSSPRDEDVPTSKKLKAPKSPGGSARPTLQASPRVAIAPDGGFVVPPSGARGTPRPPNTARPLPPQPALSPRGYRRVSSTGVLLLRETRKANLRGGAQVASSHFQYTASPHTPLPGRRAVAGGDGSVAVKAVAHTPRPLLRNKTLEREGNKAFAAVNRRPMRLLVPEKVHVHHIMTEAATQMPRAAPDPGPAAPQSSPAKALKGPCDGKQTTAPSHARRKRTLVLGNVRPVNEASPGILLRHNSLTTS